MDSAVEDGFDARRDSYCPLTGTAPQHGDFVVHHLPVVVDNPAGFALPAILDPSGRHPLEDVGYGWEILAFAQITAHGLTDVGDGAVVEAFYPDVQVVNRQVPAEVAGYFQDFLLYLLRVSVGVLRHYVRRLIVFHVH